MARSRGLLWWALVALLVGSSSCVVREVPAPQPGEGDGGFTEDIPPGVRYVGPGADATAFLRGDRPRLVVEIDQVEGSELSGAAVDHLEAVLSSVLDKPGGIEVRSSTFASDRSDYTQDDLLALEESHRETEMSDGAASMYVLVLNGQFRDRRGVLGVAYSGSSFAVFVDEARRGIGNPAPIERALLVHEAGHLLALVNIGYDSPRDREDPDHPNHSMNEGSVMHWAVETTQVLGLLGEAPPDDFDAADRADLEDIKSGDITLGF